jgi:hypothetical protein
MSAGTLPMYVVYRRPRDYPEQYVVRIQRVSRGGVEPDREPFALGPPLADVRAALPPGLYNLGRQPDDEPQIVEVWV